MSPKSIAIFLIMGLLLAADPDVTPEPTPAPTYNICKADSVSCRTEYIYYDYDGMDYWCSEDYDLIYEGRMEQDFLDNHGFNIANRYYHRHDFTGCDELALPGEEGCGGLLNICDLWEEEENIKIAELICEQDRLTSCSCDIVKAFLDLGTFLEERYRCGTYFDSTLILDSAYCSATGWKKSQKSLMIEDNPVEENNIKKIYFICKDIWDIFCLGVCENDYRVELKEIQSSIITDKEKYIVDFSKCDPDRDTKTLESHCNRVIGPEYQCKNCQIDNKVAYCEVFYRGAVDPNYSRSLDNNDLCYRCDTLDLSGGYENLKMCLSCGCNVFRNYTCHGPTCDDIQGINAMKRNIKRVRCEKCGYYWNKTSQKCQKQIFYNIYFPQLLEDYCCSNGDKFQWKRDCPENSRVSKYLCADNPYNPNEFIPGGFLVSINPMASVLRISIKNTNIPIGEFYVKLNLKIKKDKTSAWRYIICSGDPSIKTVCEDGYGRVITPKKISSTSRVLNYDIKIDDIIPYLQPSSIFQIELSLYRTDIEDCQRPSSVNNQNCRVKSSEYYLRFIPKPAIPEYTINSITVDNIEWPEIEYNHLSPPDFSVIKCDKKPESNYIKNEEKIVQHLISLKAFYNNLRKYFEILNITLAKHCELCNKSIYEYLGGDRCKTGFCKCGPEFGADHIDESFVLDRGFSPSLCDKYAMYTTEKSGIGSCLSDSEISEDLKLKRDKARSCPLYKEIPCLSSKKVIPGGFYSKECKDSEINPEEDSCILAKINCADETTKKTFVCNPDVRLISKDIEEYGTLGSRNFREYCRETEGLAKEKTITRCAMPHKFMDFDPAGAVLKLDETTTNFVAIPVKLRECQQQIIDLKDACSIDGMGAIFHDTPDKENSPAGPCQLQKRIHSVIKDIDNIIEFTKDLIQMHGKIIENAKKMVNNIDSTPSNEIFRIIANITERYHNFRKNKTLSTIDFQKTIKILIENSDLWVKDVNSRKIYTEPGMNLNIFYITSTTAASNDFLWKFNLFCDSLNTGNNYHGIFYGKDISPDIQFYTAIGEKLIEDLYGSCLVDNNISLIGRCKTSYISGLTINDMGIDIYPDNILRIIKEIMQWDSKSFFISFQDCGGYITPKTPVIPSANTIEECMSNCGVIYPDISDISAENIEYAYECLKKCDMTLDKTLEFINCMKSCRADGFDTEECSPRCRTDIGEKKSYQSCKSLCNSVECIYNCGMKQISDSAIFKCIENCKNDYSEYEIGYNQCIIGCTDLGDRDTDNDGVPDYLEEEGCLTTPDCDGDGAEDSIDPDDHNSDTDNDGIIDGEEIPPYCINTVDCDSDGAEDSIDPDNTKTDTDGDGIADGFDNFPEDPTRPDRNSLTDTDGDTVPDIYEDAPECIHKIDCDNDGLADNEDINDILYDTDNDGVPDYLEEKGCLTTPDCDGDGIVDSIDPDDHSAIPVTSAQLLCKDECENIADISEKNQCIINCYPDFIVKQKLYSCVTHCDQEYSDIYSKTDCIDHCFYISETEKIYLQCRDSCRDKPCIEHCYKQYISENYIAECSELCNKNYLDNPVSNRACLLKCKIESEKDYIITLETMNKGLTSGKCATQCLICYKTEMSHINPATGNCVCEIGNEWHIISIRDKTPLPDEIIEKYYRCCLQMFDFPVDEPVSYKELLDSKFLCETPPFFTLKPYLDICQTKMSPVGLCCRYGFTEIPVDYTCVELIQESKYKSICEDYFGTEFLGECVDFAENKDNSCENQCFHSQDSDSTTLKYCLKECGLDSSRIECIAKCSSYSGDKRDLCIMSCYIRTPDITYSISLNEDNSGNVIYEGEKIQLYLQLKNKKNIPFDYQLKIGYTILDGCDCSSCERIIECQCDCIETDKIIDNIYISGLKQEETYEFKSPPIEIENNLKNKEILPYFEIIERKTGETIDILRGTILHVIENRDMAILNAYFEKLSDSSSIKTSSAYKGDKVIGTIELVSKNNFNLLLFMTTLNNPNIRLGEKYYIITPASDSVLFSTEPITIGEDLVDTGALRIGYILMDSDNNTIKKEILRKNPVKSQCKSYMDIACISEKENLQKYYPSAFLEILKPMLSIDSVYFSDESDNIVSKPVNTRVKAKISVDNPEDIEFNGKIAVRLLENNVKIKLYENRYIIRNNEKITITTDYFVPNIDKTYSLEIIAIDNYEQVWLNTTTIDNYYLGGVIYPVNQRGILSDIPIITRLSVGDCKIDFRCENCSPGCKIYINPIDCSKRMENC